MFTYFHQNKLRRDKKGQLAPVFIVILVAVLIMAMFTLNLSKVSLTKTDTANAVDAGALAAGSTMANLFNQMAVTNSQSQTEYWAFLTGTSISFILAYVALWRAEVHLALALDEAILTADLACPNPFGAALADAGALLETAAAITSAESFIATMIGIWLAYSAYAAAQWYWYTIIRDSCRKGRNGARLTGYSMAFSNSGVGSKLKPGPAPKVLAGRENTNNYRQSFSDWMDGINTGDEDNPSDPPEALTYGWKDGQGRSHSVEVKVDTERVDKFELYVLLNPFPIEQSWLLGLIKEGFAFRTKLVADWKVFDYVLDVLILAAIGEACCEPYAPECCEQWVQNCAEAEWALDTLAIPWLGADIAFIPTFYPPLAFTWLGIGINPEPVYDDSNAIRWLLVPAWIDEIVHDRLVRLETTQSHEGADIALWQTQYPTTYSFSVVNFEGDGTIGSRPPVAKFDASIIQTDVIGNKDTTGVPQKQGRE